ncbi:hypothetical protein DL93DRAFT_579298 [Clavulina sp. PMI_390]|nr:hypothetical protein DL93DRAFT_579298 [Clavulina sp. PMI_390]
MRPNASHQIGSHPHPNRLPRGGCRHLDHASDRPNLTCRIAGRIRDLEKEWPFWAAFGGWFDFAPVLVRDRRAKAQGRSGGGQWKRFGVAGESWIFIARRKANLADAAGVHFDRRSATDSGSNDGGRVRDRRPSRSGGDMHGRDGDSEEAEGRWMIRHAVDIDALSDSELLGLRQSDAFEELLQMSLVGSGDDDDTDDEVSGEYVSP